MRYVVVVVVPPFGCESGAATTGMSAGVCSASAASGLASDGGSGAAGVAPAAGFDGGVAVFDPGVGVVTDDTRSRTETRSLRPTIITMNFGLFCAIASRITCAQS